MIDKDVLLLLVGAGIALFTGAITTIMNALISQKIAENKKRKEAKKKLGRILVMDDNVSTIDDFPLSPDFPEGMIGKLRVINSDDQKKIGESFNLGKYHIRMGRSDECDISFPKDYPVSRYHAIIEKIEEDVVLIEVSYSDSDGQIKRPTYGTFVNGSRIEEPTIIKSGDKIRLGHRLILIYEEASGFFGNEILEEE